MHTYALRHTNTMVQHKKDGINSAQVTNTHKQAENTQTHKNTFHCQLMYQKVCVHTFILYICYTFLPYSTLTGKQEMKSFHFMPKVLWLKVCRKITTWMYLLVEISLVRDSLATVQDEGSSIPTGVPGNQLSLSWGSGLATREWQHGRQPDGQAVIIWFTHYHLLIVSHWVAGTCNLESSVNSQGFWRRSECFNVVGPCSPVLRTTHSHGGFGVFSLWQVDRQLTWLTPDLSVNPQLKVTPMQVSSLAGLF